MTANPDWLELVANLTPGGPADDMPVMTKRVFNEKLQAILHDARPGA